MNAVYTRDELLKRRSIAETHLYDIIEIGMPEDFVADIVQDIRYIDYLLGTCACDDEEEKTA